MKTDIMQDTKTFSTEHSSPAISSGLTTDFWSKFSKSVWEKNTFVKRNNFVTPPISEPELFKCVVDMCVRHQKIMDETDAEQPWEIRIYVAGKEVAGKKNSDDTKHLFPQASDESFSGYSKRMSEVLDGQSFVFVMDSIPMPENMKMWTNDFLKGMYRPLGSISQGHFWSLFFGDYVSTPFGVHDHASLLTSEAAFYFPITGEKEMTTWKPSYIKENPDLDSSQDFDKHLEASTQLRAEAGGMMYWPSDRWHIGSSKGGDVSIVLAVKSFSDVYFDFIDFAMNGNMISKYEPSGIKKWLYSKIEKVLFGLHLFGLIGSEEARNNQSRNLPCDINDLQGSAHELPEAIKKIGRRPNVRRYFGNNVEKVLSAFWLLQLSNLGVESPNEPFPAISYVPKLRIQKTGSVVLLWRQVDSKDIILVADRYAHEMPLQFKSVVEAIANVKAGEECEYDDLVALMSGQDASSQDTQQEAEKLLNFLSTSGAFKLSVNNS